MLKIVIIADPIDTQSAGIHVYTRNMIDALERSGKFEVICVRIKNDQRIEFKNQVIVPSVIPFLQKDPLRIFFTLPRTIRKLNPDIVIEPAHFGPFNLPKKIKRVTVIHDLTPIKFPQWHNTLSSFLQQIFLPSILRKAALIITNSTNTSNDLVKYAPNTKVKTKMIYPSVDPYFCMSKEDVSFEKHPFFLSVGTIEPRKNLSVLLEAYRLFREKTNSNYQLIICGGSGWKNKRFFNDLKNHPNKNNILLKGYVSKQELKQLYSTTSAFIFPSLYEGFGFPVAEAMGCGAPCIVSNSSSLPEVGGGAVRYFQAESAEQLCSQMIDIVGSSELSRQLASDGLKRVNKFDMQHFTTQLENAVEALFTHKNDNR